MGTLSLIQYWITFIFIYYSLKENACLECNFDENFCNWTHYKTNSINWTRHTGETLSGQTGPNGDHTTGDGSYIYIETSNLREHAEKARLISPLEEHGSFCLTFWYSMYGQGIGSLNVYIRTQTDINVPLFSRNESQDTNEWIKASISIRAGTNYQVVLEGVAGSNAKGDIAVDDISLTSGMCSAECTFDNGLCNWRQDKDDDFDWTRKSGQTLTPNSGPLSDHTKGDNSNGHYIYIDASHPRVHGDKARLISPVQEPGSFCLTFWYSMYGFHINRLNVYINVDDCTETLIFSKENASKGMDWKQAEISFQSDLDYEVEIEGVCGNGVEGDIAIDDVSLKSQPCHSESAIKVLVPSACQPQTPSVSSQTPLVTSTLQTTTVDIQTQNVSTEFPTTTLVTREIGSTYVNTTNSSTYLTLTNTPFTRQTSIEAAVTNETSSLFTTVRATATNSDFTSNSETKTGTDTTRINSKHSTLKWITRVTGLTTVSNASFVPTGIAKTKQALTDSVTESYTKSSNQTSTTDLVSPTNMTSIENTTTMLLSSSIKPLSKGDNLSSITTKYIWNTTQIIGSTSIKTTTKAESQTFTTTTYSENTEVVMSSMSDTSILSSVDNINTTTKLTIPTANNVTQTKSTAATYSKTDIKYFSTFINVLNTTDVSDANLDQNETSINPAYIAVITIVIIFAVGCTAVCILIQKKRRGKIFKININTGRDKGKISAMTNIREHELNDLHLTEHRHSHNNPYMEVFLEDLLSTHQTGNINNISDQNNSSFDEDKHIYDHLNMKNYSFVDGTYSHVLNNTTSMKANSISGPFPVYSRIAYDSPQMKASTFTQFENLEARDSDNISVTNDLETSDDFDYDTIVSGGNSKVIKSTDYYSHLEINRSRVEDKIPKYIYAKVKKRTKPKEEITLEENVISTSASLEEDTDNRIFTIQDDSDTENRSSLKHDYYILEKVDS